MSQEQTLEPCAFCGKSHTPKIVLASEHWADEYDGYYPHSDSYAVMCDASSPNGPGGCGASGGFKATEADAIAVWNRRATHPAQAQQSEPSVEKAIMKLISVCHRDGLERKDSATPESLAALDALRAALKAQAQQVAGEVVAVPREWRKALQKLAFMAETSGGTAGADAGLKEAVAVAKDLLARPYLYTTPPQQPAPVVPDGWKLVPVDATQVMRDAGNKTLRTLATEPGMGIADRAFYVWCAMLTAAPTPPAQAGQEGEKT